MKNIIYILLLSIFAQSIFAQSTGFIIANKPTGGTIGTAANTVDKYSVFAIRQTTANQTLSIPSLTNATLGKNITIINDSISGSVSFIINSFLIPINKAKEFYWNGNRWILIGSGVNDSDLNSYLKLNGTSSMAGDLNVGGNTITNCYQIKDVSGYVTVDTDFRELLYPLNSSRVAARWNDITKGFGVSSTLSPAQVRYGYFRTDSLTSDVTIQIPNASGTAALRSDLAAYLKLNGTSTMTGNINAGGNDIAGVGKIKDASALQSIDITGRLLKDGTSSNWTSIDYGNRFGKDTLGNKIFRYNKRLQGFGISTNSNWWANLKTDSLLSSVDIQFPSQSGQLALKSDITGGSIFAGIGLTKDVDTIKFDPDYVDIHNRGLIDDSHIVSFDWNFKITKDNFNRVSSNLNTRHLIKSTGNIMFDWENDLLNDFNENASVNADNRSLQNSSNVWTVQANSSNTYAAIGGVISDHYNYVGNSSTSETTIYTDTLVENVVASNGTKIVGEYSGLFAASTTATRDLKLYFAGTNIFDSGAIVTSLAGSWKVEFTFIRTGTTTGRISTSIITTGLTTVTETDLTGLDFTTANIIKITGTAGGTGAATNDIVGKMGYLEYKSAKN